MLTAGHAMQTDVESVSPEMSLVDLERHFVASGRSAFPVIEDGQLAGIISRSDIVRQLAVERSALEQHHDFYRSFEDPARVSAESTQAGAVEAAVGERAAALCVRDAMIRRVVSVDADQPLSEVARLMLDGHIHRLPVVEKGELKGLITTLDIVRLFAQGQLAEAVEGGMDELLLAPGDRAGEHLDAIRETLEGRLDRLRPRAAAIEKDLRADHDRDSQERATERENDEVLERLGDSERRHLAQIQKALARIEAGTYDTCENCRNPVGAQRHAALPETTRCRACA